MNAPTDTAALEACQTQGWQASLALGVAARGARSVLALNRHEGPLRVVASLINSGGDLATVLQRLVLASCRHANWSMGSIMAVKPKNPQQPT